MLVLIYLAFVALVFYWEAKNFKRGRITRGKAIVLHVAYTIAPVILYGAVFMALIGVEEFTGTAIIGEGYARSLPLVVAGGIAVVIVTTLVFPLAVITMTRGDSSPT